MAEATSVVEEVLDAVEKDVKCIAKFEAQVGTRSERRSRCAWRLT